MNKIMSIVLLVLVGGIVVLLFRTIDAAIEIDSLKSQIWLQKKSLQFLQNVTNDTSTSCKTSVAAFENIAHLNDFDFSWQGQTALVGPFRVTKKENHIEKIELVGL